jgi:hypothetical protein
LNEEIPMTVCADYAQVFEREVRPRRLGRRIAAHVLWAALFLIRPRLALEIWRERRSS